MTSVGIRELRQRASELLRQVQLGETIEITDRGRPVALLAPLASDSGLAYLRETGQVRAADGDLDGLPEPLVIEGSTQLPSLVLAQLRLDER